MNTKDSIRSQFHASLGMLAEAVRLCPLPLWTDGGFRNKYWHVAYHALYYAHLYLHDSKETFVPWHKHREHYQFLGKLPWPPHDMPTIDTPYTQEEILEYTRCILTEVDNRIPSVDLAAPSGFPWLQFNRMELQFYSLRHLEHHTGALIDRLRNAQDIGVRWISDGAHV